MAIAFEAGLFEELHGRAVALLASGCGTPTLQGEALQELRSRKDAFSQPLTFRGREDTVDLNALARQVRSAHPRLVSEPLVRTVDEVSRSLRLHQHDCCSLVERALDISSELTDVPRRCAAIYYRECHFAALCIHDMAQGLGQTPPDKYSVVFFAFLGGPQFVKALFEALKLLLRDLSGERAGDQVFMSYAGAVMHLIVETLFAYYFAFKASIEEADQIISLLPQVVQSQHAPLGNSFPLSDLDILPREEHAAMSIKLCLTLVCMFDTKLGDGRCDLAKVPADANPETLELQDSAVAPDTGGLLSSSSMGDKIRAGDYWREENQLGQFLCFMVSGILLENEGALRNGYVHWHMFHFILHEVLLSSAIVGTSSTSKLVFRCIQELLMMALLPVGRGCDVAVRRWVTVRKLEAQAVSYQILRPDALQMAVLRTLNRLCRVHPPACEGFRDVALLIADTAHLQPQEGEAAWPRERTGSFASQADAAWPRDRAGSNSSQAPGGASAWFGAAASSGAIVLAAPREESGLRAEILELLATICARGPLLCARFICQKLLSHSNQWFNWSFLVDSLAQHARVSLPDTLPAAGRLAASSTSSSTVVAVCHLLSAFCSNRLAVSQPAPLISSQALQPPSLGAATPSAEHFGPVLLELLGSCPDPTVKTACLGALAHFEFSPSAAKVAFESLVAILPTLIASISDVSRNGCDDGALAIELLACALHLVQTVPISKGRYSLDLQPLTHVVVYHLLMKVLPNSAHFMSMPRYWRLGALTLRWLCLVLHGPLPLGTSAELNAALVEPYADSDSTAADIAARSGAGNATAFVFRCLLSLDSPVFAQVMNLTSLGGRGIEGLAERSRQGSAEEPFMEQTVSRGLSLVRLLLQRDLLFRNLYSQQVMARMLGSKDAAGLDAGDLLPVHRSLLKEYPFAYPPASHSSYSVALNPFASKRLWQGSGVAHNSGISTGIRRMNPSYLALLTEFVGVRSNAEIARLAMFVFLQTALRDPETVLQILRLEAWRLQCLSADLFDRIMQAEEETVVAAVTGAYGEWDAVAEEQFTFEIMEMDVPSDSSLQMDTISFQTGLPLCKVIDLVHQLVDDSVVQAADLVVWARSGMVTSSVSPGLNHTGLSSADAAHFKAAYLRGLDPQAEWVGGGEQIIRAPPPVLATVRCRLLALQTVVLLFRGFMKDNVSSVAATKIAQALLGLSTDGAVVTGEVDVDMTRAGQPCPLDAVMEILDQPPPMPPLMGRCTDSHLSQAFEQHAAYESALGIMLGLMASPSLREVALRHVCHAWPSRYEVLQNFLVLRWTHVAFPIRRLLLSELSMLLQLLSWEMRLIPCARASPSLDDQKLDVVGHQRLEMKRAVAEHLQEVVQSMVGSASSDSQAGNDSQADAAPWPPFLVVVALQLADACEQKPAGSSDDGVLCPLPASPLFQDVESEHLQATECMCLAPSDEGHLSLCLRLHDPVLFQTLVSGVSGRRIGDSLGQKAVGPAELRASNDQASLIFFANLVFSSLSLFVSALLHHLSAGSSLKMVLRTKQSTTRDQVARAHLEALLPALSQQALECCSPLRLDLLLRFSTSFLVAMQETEAPAPSSFVQDLFQVLQGVALHPSFAMTTPPARQRLQQALLLLLERPDPWREQKKMLEQAKQKGLPALLPEKKAPAKEKAGKATGDAIYNFAERGKQVDAEALEALRRLVEALLAFVDVEKGEKLLQKERSGSGMAASLPLLVALLLRVPREQLPGLFPQHSSSWQRLMALFHLAWREPSAGFGTAFSAAMGSAAPSQALTPALTPALESQVAGRGELLELRLAATSALALLCRSPQLAAAFFENAGLTALLNPDLLQTARLRVAPPGLPALDTLHPALLHVVLEVLVAITSVLPSHRLALQSILLWLGKHQQPILDLLSWVAHLPVPTAAEPQMWALDELHNPLLKMSPQGKGSFPIQFSSDRGDKDSDSSALLAYHNFSHINGPTEQKKFTKLCYRCMVLFSELWASLWVGALACASPCTGLYAEPMWASIEGLRCPFEATLLSLLVHMSGVIDAETKPETVAPAWGMGVALGQPRQPEKREEDVRMDGQGGFVLSPSKVTRLTICLQVMRAWQQDALTHHLRDVARLYGVNSSVAFSALSVPTRQGAVLQHLGQVKARSNALCTVFVHCCSALLGLRLAKPACLEEQEGPSGSRMHIQFAGTEAQFRLLLTIVEMALHQLSENLKALAAIAALAGAAVISNAVVATAVHGASPQQTPAPRPAVVVLHLRALRQFADVTGGSIVPEKETKAQSRGSSPNVSGQQSCSTQVLDLNFAKCAAKQVEDLLAELQGP